MHLDHPHRRAHDPGELEHAHPRRQRLRRERRPQVVDPPLRDAGRVEGRLPLAATEVAQVDVTAAWPVEDELGVEPGRYGVERRHVDRARRLVRVEQKNVDAAIESGGKTKNSVREVPLTGRALAALDRLPPRLDTPLLFPAPEGGPLNLDNFRRREWTPAVEAAGVETPATPYDMRDTFASNALAAGVTVFELARVMGTSVRMIERHYGALLQGSGDAIRSKLDEHDIALEADKTITADVSQ